MKMITAIIRPQEIYNVSEALLKINIPGITITRVEGLGNQKGYRTIYRGSDYEVKFLPKVKLEIAVTAEKLDAVIATIINVTCSGNKGDGKIFVTDLEKVIRIRTGELDYKAL